MPVNSIFPTPLGTRQLFSFFDPLNPSVITTPKLNPNKATRKPTSVRKYAMTTNATAVIQGGYEYPVKEMVLNWDEIDISDVNNLRVLTYISPIVMIDNNDQGFLGVLVIDQLEQLDAYGGNVWSLQMSFLAIKPYNGQTTTISQLPAPTLALGAGGIVHTGGYYPQATTTFIWATSWSKYGESTPTATPLTLASGAGVGNFNQFPIAITPPPPGGGSGISVYYLKTRLYWSTTNLLSSATFLTDVLAGTPQAFQLYTSYIQYSSLGVPAYPTAFMGFYAGGLWSNDPSH